MEKMKILSTSFGYSGNNKTREFQSNFRNK